MSIRLKTILGVAFIEAIVLAILISTILSYMKKTNEEGLENYVRTTATLFATTTKDAVLSFDLASLETFTEEFLKNQSVLYVRVLDGDKNILASGGDTVYLSRQFIADKRYSDINDNIYDVEAMIEVEEVVYGYIEIGVSTERIDDSLNEAQKLAAGIALVEMLLVALFSFALGVYLTKQLKVLRNSTRNIAAGDLDHEIEIKTHDEVGEVSKSFNTMIASLKKAKQESHQYHDELLELNKSLEDRVARRTQKISEQKQKLETAFDQLKTTQKQLVQSEKMASIGQLAAGVAHEINNPVAFVKSNINSLNRYVKAYQNLITLQQNFVKTIKIKHSNEFSEEIKHILEQWEDDDIDFINEDIDTLLKESIEGTNRVEEIVKGLKSYSRASEEIMEDCDINACLEETLKMLNNELKYKCEVITYLKTLPICQCNKGKITQVFTNLIVNASHAMEEHGVLTITTGVNSEAPQQTIRITISDTGKGIAPEHLNKLFDPFFTTKPVGEGTGLGLSISHGIIEDHKGSIDVDSEVGKGTCFTITLPVNIST